MVAEKNGIGFIGLAYYQQNRDKLNVLSINGVEPTLKTIQDGTYPLLTRSLYIYVSKKNLKKESVQKFVSFYLEHVSGAALSVGYIPLEDKAMESSKKALTAAFKK